jgi:putative DNA primase/helicase
MFVRQVEIRLYRRKKNGDGMSDPEQPVSIVAAIEGAEILAFPKTAPKTASLQASSPQASPRGGDKDSSQMGGSREASASAGKGGAGKGGDADDDERAYFNRRLAFRPLTDLGNAERFVARYQHRLRWCADIGWLYFDDKRWARAGALEYVQRCEHDTVRGLQDEAKALADSDQDFYVPGPRKDEMVLYSTKVAAWGRISENATRMAVISKRAASLLSISVRELDADPMKICVANGTLHVAKSDDGDYIQLKPHDPLDYITKISPVPYDPEATCPRFAEFMDRVQPPAEDGSKDAQVFLDQWAGLSLTGDTSPQRMVFCYGKGRNGKGVWANTIFYIGGDNAASIPIESFLDSGRARAAGQATPDLAGLPGVRMLTTSEPKKGATLDEAFVKLFTGGDIIKARHLNKDFFEFVPQAKLTMQGNYRPKISGTDEGIWGRIILMPWPVFIPEGQRNPKLALELRAEASGILNRMLDGLRLWLDKGLLVPTDALAATAEYRSDSDPLGRFLDACTRQAMGKRVSSTDMHNLFCAWAKANGETQWTSKGLSAALKERGLCSKKSDTMFWLDIELTHLVSDFVDANGHPYRMAGADEDAAEERIYEV